METTKGYTLITGGTMGIGLELAKLFAADGYPLVIVARKQKELEEARQVLSAYNVDVRILQKDLFEPNGAFEVYDEIKQQGITIHILVNNAGQGQYGLFEDTDIDRELAIVQLNICSLLVLTKLFVKDMIGRGEGKILNLSSIASKTPGPWQAVYHGTKAFVQSFSEALRAEVKDHNITVTALLPGATDTDFFRKADMESSKIVQDKEKLADPADVAADGYKALMEGDDKVISGFKNKVQVAMSNMTTDKAAAENMKKMQEPADKKK